MIWESGPWKDGLLRDADQLGRWAVRKSRIAQRDTLIEKKIFMAAYAIRKLFEANKVSAIIENGSVPCSTFRRLETTVTPWNWHRLDELFDIHAPKRISLSATALINQLIHSYIFMLNVDEAERVEGFYVTSGHAKKQKLFSVNMGDFCHLMRAVGENYPASMIIEKRDDGSYRIENA